MPITRPMSTRSVRFSIEPRGTTGIVISTETEAERDDLIRRIGEQFPADPA